MKALAPLLLLGSLLVAAPPAGATEEAIVNEAPPTVSGKPVYRQTLVATPGTWTPTDVTTTYQWLRDGVAVPGATSSTYRLGLGDIGHTFSVSVTASKEPLLPVTADSTSTGSVSPAKLRVEQRPHIVGSPRYGQTLTFEPARWSVRPDKVSHRWLRDGKPVDRGRRYRIGVDDVGAELAVEATARREGYHKRTVTSRVVTGEHRVRLRRTVRYTVSTRGHITADLATFKRLAQQTLDDPRGWRGTGTAFKRVAKGGAFTLVLSQASLLPSFGYPCSSFWSCRSGNFVVINQDRWLGASPMWNAIGRSLRDYRHMVVNHEVGHWLGHGHRYCGGAGKLAPVMMQQSKGLRGCRANPWPLPGERFAPRF